MTSRKKLDPHRNLYYKLNNRIYRVLLYYNEPIAAFTKRNILLNPNGRLEHQLFKLTARQIAFIEALTKVNNNGI